MQMPPRGWPSIKEAFGLLRPDVQPKGTFERLWVPVRATYGSGAPAGDHFKVAAAAQGTHCLLAVTPLARAPRPLQHSSTHASL
jgi:hypothetical protein